MVLAGDPVPRPMERQRLRRMCVPVPCPASLASLTDADAALHHVSSRRPDPSQANWWAADCNPSSAANGFWI